MIMKTKPVGRSKSSSQRTVQSSKILLQETRKFSNEQANLTQKVTRQRRVNKPKVTRRKERKIRAEINETERSEKYQTSMKLKTGSLRR